jgi:hypothetical protein
MIIILSSPFPPKEEEDEVDGVRILIILKLKIRIFYIS